MLSAIFSDIHSNLEALETAVSDAEKRKVERYIVLGDSIGYGANPNECFEWVLRKAFVILMGNHEMAVQDPLLRKWFSPEAREAILWTEAKMDETLKQEIRNLNYTQTVNEIMFAHSSPDAPETFRYIQTAEDAKPCFQSMDKSICFIGHTHVPACFTAMGEKAERLFPGVIKLDKTEKYLLNPGSVGQPRDGNSRLAYGVFDDHERTFEIVRLDYDNQKAADKIRKAGLPANLAERLL